jgi:hypothetical protein
MTISLQNGSVNIGKVRLEPNSKKVPPMELMPEGVLAVGARLN